MLKNIPSDKISGTKNALLFPSRAPTHHSFAFNSRFLYELKRKVYLSKRMGSLTLKRHSSFQNYNDRKPVNTFAPSPLIFKLQQEVLRFNNICMSWGSAKSDLDTNLKKNLEN